VGENAALADPRQEYIDLAKALSQDYRIGGKPAAETPQPANLEKLAASNEPAVKRAATLLLQGLKTAEKEREDALKFDERSRRLAKETLAAIERGEYKRKETYLEYDARGNLQEREYTVDESFLPMIFSWGALNSSSDGGWSPELQAVMLRIATDRARSAA